MLGTILVLATLIGAALIFLILLLIVSMLARRNGQELKSLSVSLTHGVTAEFYESSERSNYNK
jgi:hypothetical protein